jgi:hypothetical protein
MLALEGGEDVLTPNATPASRRIYPRRGICLRGWWSVWGDIKVG